MGVGVNISSRRQAPEELVTGVDWVAHEWSPLLKEEMRTERPAKSLEMEAFVYWVSTCLCPPDPGPDLGLADIQGSSISGVRWPCALWDVGGIPCLHRFYASSIPPPDNGDCLQALSHVPQGRNRLGLLTLLLVMAAGRHRGAAGEAPSSLGRQPVWGSYGASASSLAHSRSSILGAVSTLRMAGCCKEREAPKCQAEAPALSRARPLSGQHPQGWEATVGTTSGVRSCWVAVYPCAQGCPLGVLEAMK